LRDASRTLTILHGALLALVLSSLIDLKLAKGVFMDRVTPVVFWAWLLGSPLVGSAAFRASRRRGWRQGAVINGVLLGVWAVGLLISLLLH
jgi:hypothetical protein